MPDKEHIHLINAEILPILEYLSVDLTNDIQSSFGELKEVLGSFKINYKDFRSVLNPSADAWVYVFDIEELSKLANGNYIDYLITNASNQLQKESKCIFLAGDLIIDKHNYHVFQRIFRKNGKDESLLLKKDFCAITIINISNNYANILNEHFLQNTSYFFHQNITFPSIEKYAYTYRLVQKTIKLGNKLVYPIEDEGDECNYSGVVFSDKQYILCPIMSYYYSIFLTARLNQVMASFEELKYSVKSFYGVDLKDYPIIIVGDQKIEYIKKEKNICLTAQQIKDSVSEAFKLNQVFHISYTGYGEDTSMDINISTYINKKRYLFSFKWDLSNNTATLITAIPR